jgi:pyruvate ferredoxin oxidoreductase gamma subunit
MAKNPHSAARFLYRVRFHGRGGQGMKTASRLLGSAAFHAGYIVQDSPLYGAELIEQ